MFKLTYFHFKSPAFERALGKLCNTQFSDQRVTYNVAKILRRFQSESKIAQDVWDKIYPEFVIKDESGKIKPLEGRPGSFMVREDMKEMWEKACEDFNSKSVEFDCHSLDPQSVEEAKLTALELVELDLLLTHSVDKGLPDKKPLNLV